MLLNYRKTNKQIVNFAMSTAANITHEIACIDKEHNNFLCCEFPNSEEIANEYYLYRVDDSVQEDIKVIKNKKIFIIASCDKLFVGPQSYRMPYNENTTILLEFKDEDGNFVYPNCSLKLSNNRGSLSAKTFALNGTQNNLSINFIPVQETVDVEIRFYVLNENYLLHFQNENNKILNIELTMPR